MVVVGKDEEEPASPPPPNACANCLCSLQPLDDAANPFQNNLLSVHYVLELCVLGAFSGASGSQSDDLPAIELPGGLLPDGVIRATCRRSIPAHLPRWVVTSGQPQPSSSHAASLNAGTSCPNCRQFFGPAYLAFPGANCPSTLAPTHSTFCAAWSRPRVVPPPPVWVMFPPVYQYFLWARSTPDHNNHTRQQTNSQG